MTGPRCAVIVPSFRRPEHLHRCLTGLRDQQRPADDVVIVLRPDDGPSHDVVASSDLAVARVATVDEPGQVAALNVGLSTVSDADVVAILDDDATPRPAWLGVAADRFAADATLGGLGGTDHPVGHDVAGPARVIGRVRPWGKVTGNHHLGSAAACEVEFLKGANMAFRASAIDGLRFEPRLTGHGAQRHNDLEFSAAVRGRGWRLLFDPAFAVDHAETPMELDRDPSTRTAADARGIGFNKGLAVARHWPLLRVAAFLVYDTAVGDPFSPGLYRIVRERARLAEPVRSFVQATIGRVEGVRAGRRDAR